MIYDTSLALGWLPPQVRELTLADLDGLARAARRRDARAKRGKGR